MELGSNLRLVGDQNCYLWARFSRGEHGGGERGTEVAGEMVKSTHSGKRGEKNGEERGEEKA